MPKIVDHDQHREQMILDCFELFSKKGFNNVTMREIAAELQVSTGALYHYFPTKQSIFEQMMTYVVDKDLIRLRERLNSTESPEERMIQAGVVIENDKEYYQNILLLALDYFRQQPESETKVMFKAFARHYVEAISYQIDLPEKYSTIIFCWLIGLVYADLLSPTLISGKDQFETVTEIMRAMRMKISTESS
ncbi:TetR family transcriptional regulator [Candidatus Magnetomorum sp. HK-1]|nr:TetR family transcriptional regulator [Candidatus Magnetomorum sp. HK-1]